MARTFGVVAVLLAAVWSPIIGQYIAFAMLPLTAIPVLRVQQLTGPLAISIGNAVGQSSDIVAVEIAVSIIVVAATSALIGSQFSVRRSEEFGSLGIALFGILAIAASCFFRLRYNY